VGGGQGAVHTTSIRRGIRKGQTGQPIIDLWGVNMCNKNIKIFLKTY